jgi:hypothetical protein
LNDIYDRHENRQKWAELGFERGVLGYPTTDEVDAGGGFRVSKFTLGKIYWISEPNVTQRITQYPGVQFIAGDRINVEAGAAFRSAETLARTVAATDLTTRCVLVIGDTDER